MFGTDGVRGRANVELTPKLAYELGNAGATVLATKAKANSSRPKILVGRDTRISGSMLESALAAGICSAGVDVVLLGVIPTAAVAYLTKITPGAVAGIVISASHNPAHDNGIKFFGGNGYKLPDATEDEIESKILNGVSENLVIDQEIGCVCNFPESSKAYQDYLQNYFDLDLSGLKLVIDGANGAASFIAKELFTNLGADVIAIACEPDGWNINQNCGSTKPQILMETVVKERADIGLAFDGDADRLLAVDEKGNLIDGDQIMVVCAKHLQESGKLKNNGLVVTVMSNMGLHLAMEKAGVQTYSTKVGDRYVLEKMLEEDIIIGGEQSGHIIFSEINTTGDGLTTALYLLNVLKQTGMKFSQLAAAMEVLPQVMKNLPVKTKEAWDSKPLTIAAMAQANKQLAGRGRILVRPSGTEPLLRVMAEGPDLKELEQIVDEIVSAIDQEQN